MLICFLFPIKTHAQTLEIRGEINSGFYSYRGASANSISRINDAKYTNGPYGKKGAISYGASVNLKRVTRANFFFGGDIGYAMLRSKVNLDFDDALGGDILWSFQGRTFLNNGYINVYPFIGQRISIGTQTVDISIGSDIGFLVSSKEKAKATATQGGITLKTDVKRDKLLTADIRPRVQLSTDFDKIGIYIGYSYGMSNYYKNMIGMKDNKVYSRMVRLGLSYRIL